MHLEAAPRVQDVPAASRLETPPVILGDHLIIPGTPRLATCHRAIPAVSSEHCQVNWMDGVGTGADVQAKPLSLDTNRRTDASAQRNR